MNIPRIGTGPIPTAEGLTAAHGFWQRLKLLFKPDLLRDGADWLEAQQRTIDELYNRLAENERAFNKERSRIEAEAKAAARTLAARTNAAIEEMTQTKGRVGRSEQPVAVIISPYQYAQLTEHDYFRITKLNKVSLHVAEGVYGPAVLTQDAFNSFTRMAPELNTRTMDKASESDW